ncbi:GNAT family N-acetyltransferase [Nodularia sp. LEGE 06071]|nr:GNAT family N-acetyltransferase [Nodularia sp. LEGE 06071]MCC2694067.1 GNAT family N-acetyltransferase [Nodularia sp. LEGE 04288]
MNAHTIAIGYGNELRSDDGIGQRVAKALQLSQVKSIAVHQLTPELAEVLARADLAIFIDACLISESSQVQVQSLSPASCNMIAGHTADPRSLLALTQAIYCHCPADIAAGEMILNRNHIPTYPYPDTAARMFSYMWQSSYNLRGIYETPVKQDQLPKLAIRPYPTQYVSQWTMRNGTPVTIRPIRPEDEPLMVQFHQTLSEQSVYFRYFHLIKLQSRVAHERLTRICFIDYDREIALVVEYQNPETQTRKILAVGRLSKIHGTNTAEFAIVVCDRCQCQGIGTELLQRLLQVSRDEQLTRITADILVDNDLMQKVCENLGFRIERTDDPTVVKAQIEIK